MPTYRVAFDRQDHEVEIEADAFMVQEGVLIFVDEIDEYRGKPRHVFAPGFWYEACEVAS